MNFKQHYIKPTEQKSWAEEKDNEVVRPFLLLSHSLLLNLLDIIYKYQKNYFITLILNYVPPYTCKNFFNTRWESLPSLYNVWTTVYYHFRHWCFIVLVPIVDRFSWVFWQLFWDRDVFICNFYNRTVPPYVVMSGSMMLGLYPPRELGSLNSILVSTTTWGRTWCLLSLQSLEKKEE